MYRPLFVSLALSVALMGCGSSTEQKSATGAGTGAVAGAVVGGPVGALVGAAAGGAGGAVASEAEDDDRRHGTSTQRAASRGSEGCVRLVDIDSTQVVDSRTIVIKMKGRDDYKRADLVSSCPGLNMSQGFSHSTRTNDLCVTDPIRVAEPVGATCSIRQIVPISSEEARELLRRR